MEPVNFTYSTKNIPIATKSRILRRLVEKTEHFLHRLRWRCFFYLNPKCGKEVKETYGFRSPKTPPVVEELKVFEDSIIDIIQKLEFKPVKNTFQQEMKQSLKNIANDPTITVKADKTQNYYKMEKKQYEHLLKSNVTKTYKKADPVEIENTNMEAKNIAAKGSIVGLWKLVA